jgi:Leucine-rich repeat (LRR) protein
MVFIVKFLSFRDILHTFHDLEDIDEDLYEDIYYLNCNKNNLTNIDFIGCFPNLKYLDASHNKIKHCPSHNNIEVLDIYNNCLISLPIFPKLKKLFAFNNKLSSISYNSCLEVLDVSHNFIKLLEIGPSLKNCYCGFNIISKINIDGDNLILLECNNNYLSSLSFILNLPKLNKFYYHDNKFLKNIEKDVENKLCLLDK